MTDGLPGDGIGDERNADAKRPVERVVGMRLHPCCENHCRDWSETQNGKLPPSEHSPGCENYKPERFAALDYDGSKCVVEWTDKERFIDEEGPDSILEIWMTRDQFERLEEFTGP